MFGVYRLIHSDKFFGGYSFGYQDWYLESCTVFQHAFRVFVFDCLFAFVFHLGGIWKSIKKDYVPLRFLFKALCAVFDGTLRFYFPENNIIFWILPGFLWKGFNTSFPNLVIDEAYLALIRSYKIVNFVVEFV